MMRVGVFANFCEASNGNLHIVRVVDIFEVETFAFGSSLNVDVAKGKECCEESFCFTGNVLNLIEIDFGNDAIKESFLFGIDDAFACDNPNVEPVVGEFGEGENEHHEKIGEKRQHEDRPPENILENDGISKGDEPPYDNGKRDHDCREAEDAHEINPVTTKKENDSFIRNLIWERIEVDHRPKDVVPFPTKGTTSMR